MSKQDFSGPIWSVLVVDAGGNAFFDRVGLAPAQGNRRVKAILKTNIGKTHRCVACVAPTCHEEDFYADGSYVVVYLMGGWGPTISAVGLTKDKADSFAKTAIEKFGPGTPRKTKMPRIDENGKTYYVSDCTPYILKTFVIDAPEIVEMMGQTVPS